MSKEHEPTVTTTDFLLAVWLLARGHPIVVTEVGPSYYSFTFHESDALHEDMETFAGGSPMVNAHALNAARRTMRERMRQARQGGGP